MRSPALARAAALLLVGTAIVVSHVPVSGQAPSQGQWSSPISMPLVAVHTALMPTGEILMFDAWEIPGTPSARLWNPATNTYVDVPNSFAELFCAGHVLTPDGRLLTVGGHNGAGVGTTDTTIFDWATRLWTPLAGLGYARWYPGVTQLADGRVITLGGAISRPEVAEIPEAYTLETNSWTPWPAAQKDVGEYPRIFQLPNGKVFVADAANSLQSWLLDVDAKVWTQIGSSPASTGDAVMYRPGRVMMTGGATHGSDPVTAATGVIDLTAQNPSWRTTQPLANGRFLHNLVILPDGKVLAVGGSTIVSLISTTGVLPAEMWDPDTETWTTMAAMATPRMYHSTALLLPDGRVLSAGGGRLAPAIDHLNAELYSPPYLFNGARPTITNAPSSIPHGATIGVATPNAATTARVTMVRASSVTHATNYDQRFLELNFTAGAGQLNVQMPSGPNVAPPGYYMLFILNGSGVPSIGRLIRLDNATSSDPSVSISDVNIVEGTGGTTTAVFSALLTAPSTQTITVDYATADGTTTAGTDYTTSNGTLTFAPGTTTRTIAVPIVTDAILEPNETFTVSLSNPTNAPLGDGIGLGTIINDDLPAVPTVSINDVHVTEGTGTGTPVAAFTVTMSPAASQDVLISYRTLANTATSPADYASTSGVLTFAGGSTVQTIQVPIVPDAVGEVDETFLVELWNPVHAVIGDSIGIGTIVNDDSVTSTFQIAAGEDDVNEMDATLEAQDGSIWFGTGGSEAASFVGLRFAGVSIPRGATVTSAQLQVNSLSTQWMSLDFEYGAEASGNSLPFTTITRPSQRALLAPRVTHASDAQWVADTWYDLDEIAPLVQAVVGQATWSPGNAMTLVMKGTGSAWARKFAKSFETDPTLAPRLIITHSGGETQTPTVTFSASPTPIIRGGSTTLTWVVTNSTGGVIDQGIGAVAPTGSQVVSPLTTTAYTLTATNANGSASASTTVTVNAPAPTATLALNPTSVAAGNSSTLTWTTTDAAAVTIDQGIGVVASNGSVSVSPATTRTYTLTASNPTGGTAASATLTVTAEAVPPVLTGLTPPNGATGVLRTATAVTATFNENMDPASVNASTVELRDPSGALVPAIVTYDGPTRTATLQPVGTLGPGATHTARVIGGASGVKDVAGNPLSVDATTTFTTSGAPVVGVSAKGRYDDESNSSATTNPVTTRSTTNLVVYVVGEGGTSYPSIADSYNNTWTPRLVQQTSVWPGFLWAFTSFNAVGGPAHTVTATKSESYPTILAVEVVGTSVAWADSAFGIDDVSPFATPTLQTTTDALLLAAFAPGFPQELVNITPGNGFGTVIEEPQGDGSWVASVTSRPVEPGNYSATWTMVGGLDDFHFGAGLVALTGTPISDTTRPSVTSWLPASGGWSSTLAPVVVAFSEPLSPGSVNASTIELRDAQNAVVPATVTYDVTTRKARLQPSDTLAPSEVYTAKVVGGPAGVKDLAGNPLVAESTSTFTTVVAPVMGVSAKGRYGDDSSDYATTAAYVETQPSTNLMVYVHGEGGNGNYPVITDTYNNTWVPQSVQQTNDWPGYLWVFVSLNAHGGPSHKFTATKANGFLTVLATEVVGPNVVVQDAAMGSDTVSPFTSPALSPTSDALLLGVFAPGFPEATVTITPGNGFITEIEELRGDGSWVESVASRTVAPGTYSASWTMAGGTSTSIPAAGLIAFTIGSSEP